METIKLIRLALLLFFSIWTCTLEGQNNDDSSIKYIEDYYSDFSTGYNFNGKYVRLTDNYKVEITDSIFKLTFNAFDEYNKIKNHKITINLRDVLSLEPGINVVEVHNFDTIILPISYQLIFNLAEESYVIDIHFNSEERVEDSKIYKAFTELIDTP